MARSTRYGSDLLERILPEITREHYSGIAVADALEILREGITIQEE